MDLTTLTERPKRTDPAVVRTAATVLAERVGEWLGADEEDREQTIDDLAERMHYYSRDGYDFARSLEQGPGYSPNAELVEILSDASHLLTDVLYRATREWVKANDIKPPLPIESRVTFDEFGKTREGVITRVEHDMASFVVCCESEGHVRSGTGTNGTVVAYERVTLVAPPAPTGGDRRE